MKQRAKLLNHSQGAVSTKRDLCRSVLEKIGVRRLKETSTGYSCCCPYHDEKTPSFGVHEDGYFNCFGCKASGSLAKLMVDFMGMNFKDARKELGEFNFEFTIEKSALAEMTDKLPSYEDSKRGEQKEYLKDSMLGLYDYCPKYMLQRGFSKATLKHFEAGYDSETARVTIPVRDERGRLVGISKRSVFNEEKIRYLHDGFDAKKVLYNLHNYAGGRIVIVEGQTDVWRLYETAKVFAVCTLGSSLSQEQAMLLASRTDDLVMFYDDDKAGIEGSMKALELLTEYAGRGVRAVATYPKGKTEPDDFRDKKELMKVLDQAVTKEVYFMRKTLD